MKVRGRTALITGASSGFGLLTAVELARRGARVFASMRDLGRAEALERACGEAGVHVQPVQLDVTDPDSIEGARRAVDDECGAADVVVNNAGFGMGGFVEQLDMKELRQQFETNFFGLVAVTQAFLPAMRAARRGTIINVSSIQGLVAVPGLGAYCASKFAVEGLSESLRHELLPFGIYVSLVEPGMFPTDIFDRNRRVAAAFQAPESPYRQRAERVEGLVNGLVGRSKADPKDVADCIADIAESARPRLRYLVGADARAQRLLHGALPFGIWERALALLSGGR